MSDTFITEWEPGTPLYPHPEQRDLVAGHPEWHQPMFEIRPGHDETHCHICAGDYVVRPGVVWPRLFEAVSA